MARNNNGRTRRTDGDSAAKPNIAEPEAVVPLYKRLGAELIGTFALVFAAAGSDVADIIVANHFIGRFAVAAAPALIIMAMIYSLDKISGAYFNPAISLGFTITKHLKLKDLPLYILMQIIGSIFASIIVFTAIGQSDGRIGLTLPLQNDKWFQSFVLEIVLTFFLMLVSLLMKEEIGYKTFGGIAIGGVITMAGIVGMKISGASMNPARSFGPALVAGNLSFSWIYWIAPIIGSLVAVCAFKLIKSTEAVQTTHNESSDG